MPTEPRKRWARCALPTLHLHCIQVVFHDRAVAAAAVAFELESVAARPLFLSKNGIDLGVIGGGHASD